MMTNPSSDHESRPQPAAPRQPWTAPRLRTLPVGRTETGGAMYSVFDFPLYQS